MALMEAPSIEVLLMEKTAVMAMQLTESAALMVAAEVWH